MTSIAIGVVIGTVVNQSLPSGSVVPSPIPDWSNISNNMTSRDYYVSKQQIQGITEPIQLTVDDIGVGLSGGTFYVNVSSFDPSWSNGGNISPNEPISLGFAAVTLPYTFTVAPDEWVSFAIEGTQSQTSNINFEVLNVSDGSSLLDTFVGALSGSSVVPYPTPDWSNVFEDTSVPSYVFSQQQIQGITEAIDIRVSSLDVIDLLDTIYIAITPTERPWANGETVYSDPPSNGFTAISLPYTVTINRGYWVSFAIMGSGSGAIYSIDVKNVSNGLTLIDSFTAETVGVTPP